MKSQDIAAWFPSLETHTEPELSSEPEEDTPLLTKVKKPKKPHPFTKMLQGILPFGPSFRQLGLIGKIYEVTKVYKYAS